MATPLPPFPWTDLLIIVALIALNGVFAMSELAIVSARRPRLQALLRKGSKGAERAMALADDPSKFLSTVQIGITLIGIIAGAYSGQSLSGPLGARLELLGIDQPLAGNIGFAVAIVITTYLSVVIGELVPKQFALRKPEPVAIVMALPIQIIARVTAPFVWVLDRTSALIFYFLRINRESTHFVTAEELHLIFAEARKSGVIEESERKIISGVVRLADRPVREVMTPRTEIDWVDMAASEEEIRAKLLATTHSRLLVARGSIDNISGVIHARDVLAALLTRDTIDLATMMRTAPIVPDQVDAMDALATLRQADVPIALVHDEYGHFEGIVTPVDLLSAIAGGFASDAEDDDEPAMIEREDGSLLISGWAAADDIAERLCLDLPEDRDYATAAGFALETLKHIPQTGEVFEEQGWRFEVIDMDGRKIDKLLAVEIE